MGYRIGNRPDEHGIGSHQNPQGIDPPPNWF